MALLTEVARDTPVLLATGSAESLRLGERTLRRHAIAGIEAVPRALRHLVVARLPRAAAPGDGPLDARRSKPDGAVAAGDVRADEEAREHVFRLRATMLNERPRPTHRAAGRSRS